MADISWADLTYSIARHLGTMPEDTYFALYVDDSMRPGFDPDFDNHAFYVQFCAYSDDRGDMVRCEVVSNRYLPPDRRHSIEDLIMMRADGWTLPEDERAHDDGTPNIHVDVPAADADRAARMILRVFVDVWRVRDTDQVITDAEYVRGRHPFRVVDAPAGYLPSDPIH